MARPFLLVLALVMLLSVAPAASGQGTSRTLPDPISGRDLSAYARRLGLSASQRLAVDVDHEEYLADFRILRDTEITEYMEESGNLMRSFLYSPDSKQARKSLVELDRLTGRIKSYDARLFDAMQAILTEDQLVRLARVRQMRERTRNRSGLVRFVEYANAGARVDLSRVMDGLDLRTETRDEVDPILTTYEGELTRASKRLFDETRTMFTEVLEEMERLMAGADPRQDPRAARRLWGSMRDIWTEKGKGVMAQASSMSNLNRRTFRDLALTMPEEEARSFQSAYYERAYRTMQEGVAKALAPFDTALHSTLDDERKALVQTARTDFRGRHDRLSDQMIDLLETQRRELGTAATMDMTQAFGGLPTRNFQQGQFEEFENITGTGIRDTRLVANKACFACTIACGRVCSLGEHSDKYMVNMHPRNWKIAGEGPEYENAWALGADCGVGDLDAVLKANWLCNDLGLDPISMGSTLASAMELYETGVVTDDQVEMPLKFGSSEALIRMTEATAYREGFGDELAEGAKRMGDKFNHPEVFMGSKGQEFPAYDPRGFQGMGVAYATCNRGACHLRAWTPGVETTGVMEPHTTEGKSEWVVHEQNRSTSHDNTGLCLFVGAADAPIETFIPCTAAATGVPYTLDDFVKIGERTWNLEKLFNLKAGLTKADDSLPKRILSEGHKEGPSAGVTVNLDAMLPIYYKERGWDEEGVPSAEKLAELGLASI